MPNPGLAVGGASSLLGAGSARSAARSQEAAANRDLALRERMYDETVDRFQPFYDDGRDYAQVRNYLDGIGGLPTLGGTSLTVSEGTRTVPGDPNGQRMGDGGPRGEGMLRGGPDRTEAIFTVGGQTFTDRGEADRYATENSTGGTEYAGFQATPGYQFAVDQGTSAIEGSAAARGGLYSGRTMQDLNTFGQGIANQEFNNYYNRISGGAAQGQAAAGQQAQAGQNYAQGASNALGGIGNAQAAGAIGVGNALQGGLSNGLGLFNYQNNLNGSGGSPLGGGGSNWLWGNSWS